MTGKTRECHQGAHALKVLILSPFYKYSDSQHLHNDFPRSFPFLSVMNAGLLSPGRVSKMTGMKEVDHHSPTRD